MSVSMLTTCFMFIVNGKCLRWLFHYDAKLSYHQHYQNIFFFCSLRVCVCVLSWYFLPFSSFTCCFFGTFGVFFQKKNSLPSFCRIATTVITTVTSDCYECCSLRSVGRSVRRLAGWLVVFSCLYVYWACILYVFFIYLSNSTVLQSVADKHIFK